MDHDDSDIVVLKVLFSVESDSFSFEFSDYPQVGTTVVRSSLVLLWLLLFVHTYFFKVRASLTASIPSCVKHETWISARHFTAWGMSLWVMLFNRTFFVFSAVVFFSIKEAWYFNIILFVISEFSEYFLKKLLATVPNYRSICQLVCIITFATWDDSSLLNCRWFFETVRINASQYKSSRKAMSSKLSHTSSQLDSTCPSCRIQRVSPAMKQNN